MRGRPKEYESRYPLTVSVEKDLWDYAQKYGILARDALSYGLQGLIETDIIKTKQATPEEIDRYLEIKNRELQYSVNLRNRERDTIQEISNIRDDIKQSLSIKTEPAPITDPLILSILEVIGAENVAGYARRVSEGDYQAPRDLIDGYLEIMERTGRRCPVGCIDISDVKAWLRGYNS